MPSLSWSDEATRALQQIYHFLAIRDEALAKRAVRAIQADARKLKTFPYLGHPVAGSAEMRELTVSFGRNGYVMQYSVESGVVLICGVRPQRVPGW
ncbi:type II toxin-antitoxin system RelE/ParE family toxin [Pseudoduganella aquatica]|uniref:type II toxin-antitoxin system RelE/ParE family toxin n=1 Tax=Pseudoduganella aquatica TaxID=2660641 RepID=UPI001E50ECAB|nr:type II toxin-antitoxin system RelE/ParE family toxin [Pseudoduganella aquatica]